VLRRFREDQQDKLRIAVRRRRPDPPPRRRCPARDRIRMNALAAGRTFFRSLATRGPATRCPSGSPTSSPPAAPPATTSSIVETPGIGQGDSGIVDLADLSLYVMTPEFGAASQLEKIDMLDFADVVAINKFERRGAEDARRDVARQLVRNREAFGVPWEDMPVFGTSAARFGDDGVTALYQHLRDSLGRHGLGVAEGTLPRSPAGVVRRAASSRRPGALPAEIAETVRGTTRDRRGRRARAARSPRDRRRSTAGGRAGPALARCSRPKDERSTRSRARRVAATRDVLRDELVQVRGRGDRHALRRRRCPAPAPARRLPGPGRRRAGAVPARGEPARRLPVHRRGVPVQAGRRGPGPDVRRRGRRVPHQPPLPPALAGQPADPAVDGVRLVTLYGRDPTSARRLRQGRHLRRLDRDLDAMRELFAASTCARRRRPAR
jgi:methylmalonyl-CoA mutase